MASSLTLTDQGSTESSFQIREFTWDQRDDTDQLIPSTELVASPPLGTIPPGVSQIVRLILRKPPIGREVSYRIFLDQIPSAAPANSIQMAIRLSIPIFAEPQTRVNPHLKWHAEVAGRGGWLVAENDGSQHDTIRNIALSSPDGRKLHVDQNASPYVLAGATRRWRVPAADLAPFIGRNIQLTAAGESAAIAESVPVTSTR